MNYHINEDGTVTRIPHTPPSGGSGNNIGCWIVALGAIIICILIAGNSNNSTSNQETVGESHSNDKSIVDKVKVDERYDAPYLELSSSSVSFDADGGTYIFNVNCNSVWNISTDTDNWGHLSRSGNQLTLSVERNNSSESRTDYFVISSRDKSIKVNISQAGIPYVYLNVSQTNHSFSSSGGFATVDIETNSDWIVSVSPSFWVHLNLSGDKLTIRVDGNSSSSPRTDYFNIKAGNVEKTINIYQDGEHSTIIM